MQTPPAPPDEAHRLAVLPERGLLDSVPEGSFDVLVHTAARLTGCPIASVTLIDDRRQWCEAAHGLAAVDLPRKSSFCAHTVLGETLLEVPDTHGDARFADDPLVRGEPHVRFYAGEPLRFRGAALGVMFVMDTRARALSAGEREALNGLARLATDLLIGRRRLNALRDEQRRLLDFGRASGDWMWETDAQLHTTWVSGEFESVTGLAPQAVLGRPMADLPLLDARGMASAHRGSLRELMARRQAFSRALTAKSSPRGLLYISRSAVPVFDDAGGFAGYRGTARDVTAQVEAVRRSRSHDVLLRKLSAQVPGALFQLQLSVDGRYSYPYASEGVLEVFGVERPFDGLGSDSTLPLRLLHADDRAGVVDSLRDSARCLSPWQREYRIVRDDGALRWLETRAVPERLDDGGTLWHGYAVDVTDRKQTELALRRSEERWAMAADAAGIGIAEVDLHSGAMLLDHRACLNHGLPHPLDGFTLDDWLGTVHADDQDAARRGLQGALETKGTLETRYRILRPDGAEATLEITARGRYDAHGVPIGLVGTFRDVTAQLAVERLQRDKEAAERANRAKSEFLSRVSHELRTPLNGILGFAQLMSLDRASALAPEQQRRLDSVVRAGRHLLGLINDVLDVARIESEDFSLHPVCVDLGAAVAECLTLIQPLAQEAGVSLPPPAHPRTPCRVHADPRALEQVLMNLLSNAIKYNRPGGAVEITIEPHSVDSDGLVRIAIRDEGRGMSEAQQASLFQPFNRLGAEHTRTEGSGLGLVISRRLVDAMGGRLHVHSRPGSGSTFSVDLPASRSAGEAAPAAALVQAAPPAARTGPREVLYIEDEPLNMVLMEEVFRTRPEWTLLVADDGATGMRIARAARPDLVLIDMNLPDTNGLALIRLLRGDPRTRLLRCIALSADAMSEQIDAARAAGFDDYWTKPIDVQRVLRDLGQLLAR